ncbi:MAG: LamG domain-containing protein [Myxococcaceae bacterium]|nr:LamG domain-containing protein [Myxococcaceae bacterium]
MNRTLLFVSLAVALAAGAVVLGLRASRSAPAPLSPPTTPAPSGGSLRDGLVGLWDFDDAHGQLLHDSSGKHDGVVVGEFVFGGVGVLGRAAVLDGRTGWAVIPDAPDLRPQRLSVSIWFNPSRELTGPATLVVKPQSPAVWVSPFLSWMIRVNGATSMEATVGSAGRYLYTDGLFQVPHLEPGRWRHAVLTFDGAVLRFFLDGRRVAERAFEGPLAYSDLPILVGADFGASPAFDFFPGRVDQLALWSRPLSSDEVLQLFGGGRGVSLP